MTLPEDADDNLAPPTGAPPLPTEPELDESDRKTALVSRLRDVLASLPGSFVFNNVIAGVNATDLHALNGLLGTSIESQVVKALNEAQKLWDPDDEWLGYRFERQAQTFPDVRLVRRGSGPSFDIALGIELKGWFLLAKEGVPSFRFTTTPGACADHDLLVVVPWYLDNVLSGKPAAAQPYVVSSRWAAEYRNYYWQHMRDTRSNAGITSPADAHPYPPTSADLVADMPAYDGGGNFGRVARVKGLMTQWIKTTNQLEVLGIRIEDWRLFLQAHRDNADLDEVSVALLQALTEKRQRVAADKAGVIIGAVRQIAAVFSDE